MPRPTAAGMAAAGRAVRAWRASETQQAVAARAGIDTDTLGSLEAGAKWPWNRTLRAIEDALGQPRGELDKIAAEADTPDRSPPAQPEGLREGTKAAIRTDISDPVLAEQVIAYVEGVATGRIRPAREAREGRPPEGDQRRHQGRA